MWRARRWPWPRPRWVSSGTAAAAISGEPARRPVAALWGNGDYGRLGLGALESRWSPTACPFFVARPGDPPASLACGGAHTLFLTQNGRVFATGLNDFGQLGIGSSITHTLDPIEVSGFHERVVEISAGNHHSCAVTADGELFIWGKNSSGQLGLGKSAGKIVSTPRKVDYLADVRVKMVALGSDHSIAVTEEGEALSWGAAGAGRLGHGHKSSILGFPMTSNEYTPRLIKNLDGIKIKRIAAGMLHSACIDEKGTVFIFGQKTEKVFGRSNDVPRPSVVEEIKFSEEVACGGYHTCVVTEAMQAGALLQRWMLAGGAFRCASEVVARDEGKIGEAFFNKRHPLLWCCDFVHRCLSPIAGHGGAYGGGEQVSCCCRREGWGKFISELIHAAGYSADAILCRQGGASSTSTMEALLRHRHGCSNPLCREVIRSPRRSEGPWWLLVAGKKLLSSSPTCINRGDLYSWGSNENGCLGLGGTGIVRSPEVLRSSLFKLPVSKVSCGWKHTAVISGEDIYTWGWGGANGTFFEEGQSSGGQLGHGNDVDYFEPMMVEFAKNARAVHVSCGFNHTGAILEYTEN